MQSRWMKPVAAAISAIAITRHRLIVLNVVYIPYTLSRIDNVTWIGKKIAQIRLICDYESSKKALIGFSRFFAEHIQQLIDFIKGCCLRVDALSLSVLQVIPCIEQSNQSVHSPNGLRQDLTHARYTRLWRKFLHFS